MSFRQAYTAKATHRPDWKSLAVSNNSDFGTLSRRTETTIADPSRKSLEAGIPPLSHIRAENDPFRPVVSGISLSKVSARNKALLTRKQRDASRQSLESLRIATEDARGADTPRAPMTANAKTRPNPFEIDLLATSRSGVTKSRNAVSLMSFSQRRLRPSKLSSRFLARFQAKFQLSLDELTQQISTDRLNVKSARLKLQQIIGKKEQDVKIRHVKEAVEAFHLEKLVFVYGAEFRGRYISRSHGDILKA